MRKIAALIIIIMMRYSRLATWLATLLVGLGTLSWTELAAHEADGADAADFRGWVATLASAEMEGRGPGTRGIELARDWLVERMRATGLGPAFGESYLQAFTADLGVEATRAMLSASSGAVSAVGRVESDFTVLGFSATGAFEGEAVFVGYGVTEPKRGYDSFADLSEDGLAGKVAVAFRYEPMDAQGESRWAEREPWSDAASLTNKASWAARHGAAALLVVNPPGMDATNQLRPTATTAFTPAATIPVLHLSSQWLADAIQAGEIKDGRAFFREMQTRADRGRDKPVALGVSFKGDVAIERRSATLHNVAAVFPGADRSLADEWVIVGAHYDHLGYGEVGSLAQTREIHPGADDNASGTAGLLLLAKRLGMKKGSDAPRRSVMFILFSGEERGLLGSMHFTKHMADLGLSAANVTAMINFDMIGRLRDDKVHVFGAGTGEGLHAMVNAAGKTHGLKLTTSGSGLGMSDHTAFYFKRIPALHLFTGIHEDYHKPSDTADTINAAGGVKVIDLAEDLVMQLSTQQPVMAFIEADDSHSSHATGMKGQGAQLGIMPDYATLDGDSGCGVSGVTPEGPAAKAGLRDGDIITRWDDTPIANVRDLTTQLAKARPRNTVTLTIRRGDQTLTLPVTLGRR